MFPSCQIYFKAEDDSNISIRNLLEYKVFMFWHSVLKYHLNINVSFISEDINSI